MSDQVTASTNLTKRGSTYQFVLRVPKDLVYEIGKARIQFSLGTSSENEARLRFSTGAGFAEPQAAIA